MNRQGFTLVVAIFIVLVFSALAVGFAALFFSESRLAVEETRYNKAFYLADAGKNYALKQLSRYPSWNLAMGFPITKSFAGGIFRVTTTNESFSTITIIATGVVTIEGRTYQRSVSFAVTNVDGGPFGGHSLFTWGTGVATEIGSNVLIEGSLFIGGDLVIGSNTTISGEVSSTGTITTGSGTVITGTIESHATTPETMPVLDAAYYNNKLAIAASQVSGDLRYENNEVATLEGTTYVNGDLYFANNVIINVVNSAEIVVTGKVDVANSITIGDHFSLIAGGQVTINNIVDIGGQGLWYSGTGISVNNNAEIGTVSVGEGTTFISAGDIDFHNNCSFAGLVYSNATLSIGTGNTLYGILAASEISVVGNNSQLIYQPELIDLSQLIGLSGTNWEGRLEVVRWSEIY